MLAHSTSAMKGAPGLFSMPLRIYLLGKPSLLTIMMGFSKSITLIILWSDDNLSVFLNDLI